MFRNFIVSKSAEASLLPRFVYPYAYALLFQRRQRAEEVFNREAIVALAAVLRLRKRDCKPVCAEDRGHAFAIRFVDVVPDVSHHGEHGNP